MKHFPHFYFLIFFDWLVILRKKNSFVSKDVNCCSSFFILMLFCQLMLQQPILFDYIFYHLKHFHLIVITLALGSWPKQGLVKVRAKREAQESHFMLLGMQENVREWTLTLSSEFPLWELEYRWTLESSENNGRGQNPLDWWYLYIINKLLKHKFLKWACMTHLDT